MISNRIRKAIQISVFAAGAALGTGAAQAAAYTGTWDPAYGSAFPKLGWKGTADFYIPDACLLQSGWIDSTTCSGMAITSGHVDLYGFDVLNPSDNSHVFASYDFLSAALPKVTQMQVTDGDLSGIRGGFLMPWNPSLKYVSDPYKKSLSFDYGKDTYFWLAFDGGPEMFHVTCDNNKKLGNLKNGGSGVLPFPTGDGANKDKVKNKAVDDWLESNYLKPGSSTKDSECEPGSHWGWNSNGSGDGGGGAGPLSWSTAGGSLIRTDITQVPEPASLALVLSALGAGWLARRRRS